MKKKIQRMVLLAMALIGLVSHGKTFAIEPTIDTKKTNGFFSKNEEFPLYIGLKSWAKGSIRTIDKHWTIGGELAIGPVIEWRPLNGVGIQSGLMYSYVIMGAFRLDIEEENMSNRSPGSFFLRDLDRLMKLDEKSRIGVGLDRVIYHTLTIPLFLRIYPDKNRQFVLYGGPCFVVVPFGITGYKEIPYLDIGYQKLKYEIFKEGILEGVNSIFDHSNKNAALENILIWTWDIGFEFMSKSGLIVGINWVGITLGYDFSKLFFT